eukprot:Hpha_TRINITY_DN15761_c9_g1::TRINITY_DN15761_c9_g1_i1::g.38654::m.38654
MANALDLFYFILPQDGLFNTPSRSDGLSPEVESELRRYGVGLLQDAGVLLALPQVCVARAAVLLQRFYFRVSLREVDVAATAVAALFLATKLEECARKLRQVLTVFHRLFQRARGRTGDTLRFLDVSSAEYFELRAATVNIESRILRELGFNLIVDHPHKYVCTVVEAQDEILWAGWRLTGRGTGRCRCLVRRSMWKKRQAKRKSYPVVNV